MATLGKWSGGTTSLIPGTSFAAPNGMFPTEDRNDSSDYTFTDSTATLTLPATIVADGYLVVAAVELEDTSNGRANITNRFVYTGSGTFVGGRGSGYCRDNSEDRAYVRSWGFVDNPSGSDTLQFQWARDTDTPTGGTVRSEFQVIPLYYSDWGAYTSSSTTITGGTTPTVVTGFTGTDGSNISISSNVVTLSGANKRYLCLGSFSFDGIGSARTQRWGGFRVDSVKDDSSKAYSFIRSANNDKAGACWSNIIERAGSNVTIEMFLYRGDGVANGDGGADVDGSTTASNAEHAMVLLELNDACEVFKATGSTNQNIATTGPIDVSVSKVSDIDINDSASWTRASDTAMNAEKTMDALIGANIGAASEIVSSAQRFTGYSEITVNGVEDSDSFNGAYLRGNQGTEDTFGWSSQNMGFQALTSGDDVGVSCTELSGSEGHGGAVHIQAGWVGFWGLNLDTMEAVTATRRVFIS